MNYITAQEANKIALENKHFSDDDTIISILEAIKSLSSRGYFAVYNCKLDINQQFYFRRLGYKVKEVFPYNKYFKISWDKVKGGK